MVRFRLKKSLPFDPNEARVSYHAQSTGKGMRAVAAVVLNKVLEEYESAFRDVGYNAGMVMPSMLAALGAADAEQPTLVVKVDARTISIAILDQEKLLLFRTLENVRGVTITGDQLAEEVYPSVVFFQDTYNLNIERVYVAGLPEAGVGQVGALQVHAVEDEPDVGGHPLPAEVLGGVVGPGRRRRGDIDRFGLEGGIGGVGVLEVDEVDAVDPGLRRAAGDPAEAEPAGGGRVDPPERPRGTPTRSAGSRP